MPSRDDDIETMPEDDLLTIPSGNVPPGLLTMLWARHSAVIYQRRIEELNRELSGAYTRHVMLFPGQSPEEKRRREEEEARRRYVQAMLDIHQRSDRLLAAIEFREREIEWHRQEIEDRALKLHDGRRVYFDGTGYRDETGRVLAGEDANEAAVLDHERPDAPTWQERQKTIDQYDEMERLRKKVLQEEQKAAADGQGLSSAEMEQRQNDAKGRMNSYEQQFDAQVKAAHDEMAKAPDVASAYADTSLDDYAGPAGGKSKSSEPDFTRAVAGLISEPKAPEVIPPTAPNTPKPSV
jgi:hypothetical protein